MATELKIPAVGESITEVFIGSWLKQEGDPVRTDEIVVEIETDKATMEIPSPVTGRVVKLLKQPGDSATSDEVIAHIEEGEVEDAGPAEVGSQAAEPAAAAAEAPAADAGHVMPAAAKLAAESGIDASALTGSGPGGRVLKEDVQQAARSEERRVGQGGACPGATAAG